MNVTVSPIPATKKELTRYVKFGIDLYKGNPYFVPPLIFDDVNTLTPGKNPAFEFSEAQSFMAYRDGKPAGRITAIINRLLNEKTGRQEARFGFVDFIDDPEVSRALFETAEQWARERGMKRIIGPMGFSDMDHEGMLVEGFEEMGTMATIYNYPYYPKHLEAMGYTKDTDWVEYRITIPDKLPEKMERIAEIVLKKYQLRIVKYTSRKKLAEKYGEDLFRLINDAYADLYGYSPLTDKQIDYYIDMYLGFLKLDYVSIVVDSADRLVGVGISMPSMTKALQKSGGKLFPTGWWHLLRAMKGHNDVVDLMLIAVKPEYQSKGVNSLFFYDLCNLYIRDGVKFAETNLELEENTHVQSQWEYFERRQHRRRRAFTKDL
ncbi:GNAT family N-acetyltransferase [uncultured Duncaniella sp.]|jgi:GNAT superfamily N-acetyltransferase|uniref:GNAT family N-acetyltransferase n=1 Tax=uncultured Duncaniella sp. TaxID=2768039 RepID=UPI002675C1A4|nr:GNAT family N-acetyltransferase [uncultured Duncaniella sp.]MCI9171704.1 GNAT family N-acetyltransferase [Muribaculaceae bacterium]